MRGPTPFHALVLFLLLCVLVRDLRKGVSVCAVVIKVLIVGFILFGIELAKNNHPSWVVLASGCLIMVAPWLVSGDFNENKKRGCFRLFRKKTR